MLRVNETVSAVKKKMSCLSHQRPTLNRQASIASRLRTGLDFCSAIQLSVPSMGM